MNTSALITMLVSELVIIAFTAFFFVKILTIPPKAEPDSYSENDEEQR